jgi:hypothetical protein
VASKVTEWGYVWMFLVCLKHLHLHCNNYLCHIIFKSGNQHNSPVTTCRVCDTAQGVHLWGILWPTPELLILFVVITFRRHRTLQWPVTSRSLHCPLQDECRMHLWISCNDPPAYSDITSVGTRDKQCICATGQEFSVRLLTTESRVRFWLVPGEVYEGRNGTRTGLYPLHRSCVLV